jgi:hypothetical protein
LATAPFDDPRRAAEVDALRVVDLLLLLLRAVPDRLPFELVRLELERAVLDDPFPLVDLLDLEPLDELRLEDRVVCAIVLASLFPWLPCQLRSSRRGFALPDAREFELAASKCSDCRFRVRAD